MKLAGFFYMKTKGQIQDMIAKEATKFYAQALGVGPRETRAYIVDDMVILRFKSKLLPIEQKLLEGHRGIELIKDIRKSFHEVTTQGMNDMIKSIVGHTVTSTHSDISTKTGEIVHIFVLDVQYEKEL